MPYDPDDDFDPLLARRRQRKARAKRRKLILATVCGVVAVCVVGFVLVNKLGGPGGISITSRGEKWTYQEMAEHLKQKGVRGEWQTPLSLPAWAGTVGHHLRHPGDNEYLHGFVEFEKLHSEEVARQHVGQLGPKPAAFYWGP